MTRKFTITETRYPEINMAGWSREDWFMRLTVRFAMARNSRRGTALQVHTCTYSDGSTYRSWALALDGEQHSNEWFVPFVYYIQEYTNDELMGTCVQVTVRDDQGDTDRIDDPLYECATVIEALEYLYSL